MFEGTVCQIFTEHEVMSEIKETCSVQIHRNASKDSTSNTAVRSYKVIEFIMIVVSKHVWRRRLLSRLTTSRLCAFT